MLKEQTVSYTEHVVQRGPYHMYAREYPGEEPTIVLMHGFPDTLHLYDRLLPWLSPSRRVVTFDFLVCGSSGRCTGGRSADSCERQKTVRNSCPCSITNLRPRPVPSPLSFA